MINHNINVELEGRYKLTVRKADLSIVQETPWFNNIITNQGLNQLGIGGFMNTCRVGTGTSTPVATNTALQNSIAASSAITAVSSSFSSVNPYYSAVIQTWRFAVGEAAGNLSEVGIFFDALEDSCASRSRILDGGGNPTTITVLSDEILDVTYECRTYMQQTNATGTLSLEGVTYNWTARSANAAGGAQHNLPAYGAAVGLAVYPATGPIAAVTSEPTGLLGQAEGTFLAYVTGTNRLDYAMSWNIDNSNETWNSFFLQFGPGVTSHLKYQVGITPGFVKTNVKVVSITFRLSWARRA